MRKSEKPFSLMKHLWLCYSLSCSHTSTLSWRCGICNFSYLYFYCNLYYRPVFSWESKPKLVKSHPSDQSEHKPMRTQSENMSNKLPEVQSTILNYFCHFVENCSTETRWCVLHHEIQFETKHILDLDVEFLAFLHVISRLPA